MEITYMQMQEADIPAVAAMEEKYFPKSWTEDGIRRYFEAGSTIFLVAKDDNQIVGYAALLLIGDEGNLVSIAVDEDYRRVGIARELLDFEYDLAKRCGVKSINLEVRAGNLAAIRLYESEGFEKVGIRPKFYSNPAEDAVLFDKVL